MRQLPPAFLAVWLMIPGKMAGAQPRDEVFTLTYEAAPGCPPESTFRADVADHVHDSSRADGIQMSVKIERHDGGYLGTLVAFDKSKTRSTRQINGTTCSDVAHALAFLAGVFVELGGRVDLESSSATKSPMRPPVPAPPPPATQPPAQAPTPAVPSAMAAPAPSARAIDASVVLLGGAVGGFGPGVRPRGEIAADISSSRRSVLAPSIRVAGFVGTSSWDGQDGAAALWFVGARLEFCPLRLGSAVLAVRPCVGGELGDVRASGQVVDPRTLSTMWASVEISVRAQWFVNRYLFIELGAGPVVPLELTSYYFVPNRTLYVVPSITARGALGVGAQF